MPQLVNLKDAAEELKVSIHTLRSWIYQRRLPHVKLGRRVLLRREDLESLVNKNLWKQKIADG